MSVYEKFSLIAFMHRRVQNDHSRFLRENVPDIICGNPTALSNLFHLLCPLSQSLNVSQTRTLVDTGEVCELLRRGRKQTIDLANERTKSQRNETATNKT